MQLGVLPQLNKSYILSNVSQEQIFEYYLGIKIETGTVLNSPPTIRHGDKNASFSFYYNSNGKLRAQDHAGYFHGDCLDAVAHILRLNAEDKKSFNVILDQIARDFRLHKYKGKDVISTGDTSDYREVVKTPRGKVLLQFQPRVWTKDDAKFWLAGNINKRLLEIGRVYPCNYIWINNNLKYNYYPNDPAYAYYFGPNDIKFYFPNRKDYRFITNTSYLQGIDLLEPDQFGVITKSYKDVLALKSFGIQAVAPPSETHMLTRLEWNKINYICEHWFSLMDFDRTGILMAKRLRDTYNIRPLFFGNYRKLQTLRNLDGAFKGNILASNYNMYPGVKDFYDKVKLGGVDEARKLIDNTRESFERIFDDYNNESYNQLSWIYNDYKRTHYAI